MNQWFRNVYARFCSPFIYVWTVFRLWTHADVFSRVMLRWVIAVVAVMLGAPPSAEARTCQGRVTGGTIITGKTTYDPFSPVESVDSYQIAVANTGDTTCTYALLFHSDATAPRLGATLTYYLSGATAPSLVTNAPAEVAPALRTSQIAPSASAQSEFQLIIPRGQFAAPGRYADTLILELYALDESGRISGSPLQSATVALSYEVASIFSVNIKGADATSSTTVRFGTLAKGQEARVEIQARSNQDYRLDLTSDNGGVLALTPKVPGQSWSVPYTAMFGGRVVDLTSGASVQNQPPTRPESDACFPLFLTIGDVSAKRAGRYEDVITIEIRGMRF
jgi:hypothetical protein